MKGRRAHLKNESLIHSDRLELVDDTDAVVRAEADVAGVEMAEPVTVVEDGGAARLLGAAGVSKRAPPRLFVADIEAEAALGGATAPWWAAAMASGDARGDCGG